MPNDFHAMQQQAIDKMKAVHANASSAPKASEAAPEAPKPPPRPEQNEKPPQDAAGAPSAPSAPPDPAAQGRGLFSRLFDLENDTALILPLLLLLGREGADEGLLLALLYIMM